MKKNLLIYMMILLGTITQCIGQQNDTLKNSFKFKSIAVPTSLIVVGLTQVGHGSKEVQSMVLKQFPLFQSHLDDYAQYLPVSAALLSGTLGLKPQHDFKARLVYTAISYVSMTLTVELLKKTVKETRPDNSDSNSFPSGHTATAFTGAELFHQELKYSHPILSYAAFPIAAGVGVYRMLNNKHYLSDVLVGAGIGILSAKFAYSVYHPPIKNKASKSTFNLRPTYLYGRTGLTFAGSF